MPRFSHLLPVAWGLCLLAAQWVSAASPPSETLFPGTAKGFVSLTSLEDLDTQFNKTKWGELARDPLMKPFWDDLGDQLELKLSAAGVDLGIGWADLEKIAGGEIATAMIQPSSKAGITFSRALLVDVSGKEDEAKALLATIDKNLRTKGATGGNKTLGGDTLHIYKLAKKEGGVTTVVYAIHGSTLLATDHEETAADILGRIGKASNNSLSVMPAFQAIQARIKADSGERPSQIRWFVEPLGYAETVRAAGGGRKKRGTDPLKVLRAQGFDALQGVGGCVHLAADDYDVLHHSYLHAPPAAKAEKGKRFVGAANILDFTNSKDLEPQAWVPNEISTYLSLHVNVDSVFANFGGLFDAFTEPGTWDEILNGLKEDPNGPMVDIPNHIVKNVSGRVTLLSDYVKPITPKSERLLVAIELKAGEKSEKEVAAAIQKIMKAEPNAHRLEHEGHEIWELSDHVDEAEIPELKIDGPGLVTFEKGTVPVAAVAPPAAPWTVTMTVANGHIFIGTHRDVLLEVLKKRPAAATLAAAPDYIKVSGELTKLGAAEHCVRHFTRTDEAFYTTYELIRMGKMPQAETLLARMINALSTADAKGGPRKALIEGDKLPDFEKIRSYFGPGGLYMQSEKDGWKITGCILK